MKKLLIFLALGLVFIGTSGLPDQDHDLAVLKRYQPAIMSLPGVTGSAYGYCTDSDGTVLVVPSIVVYTADLTVRDMVDNLLSDTIENVTVCIMVGQFQAE